MKATGRLGALHPKFIVGVGGSAGALNAYKALLEALSPDTGVAFVIISHMSPSAHSELYQIQLKYSPNLQNNLFFIIFGLNNKCILWHMQK